MATTTTRSTRNGSAQPAAGTAGGTRATTVVADAAYALIGVGDAALERLRTLSSEREQLPDEISRRVEDSLRALRGALDDAASYLEEEAEEARTGARSAVSNARTAASETLEELTHRGRSIVQRVTDQQEVGEAGDEFANARANLTGLLTTLQRAAGSILTQLKAVRTSSTQAGTTGVKAAGAVSEDIVRPRSKPDYESQTKAELYELASQRDIEGRSGMSKQQLIKALKA